MLGMYEEILDEDQTLALASRPDDRETSEARGLAREEAEHEAGAFPRSDRPIDHAGILVIVRERCTGMVMRIHRRDEPGNGNDVGLIGETGAGCPGGHFLDRLNSS